MANAFYERGSSFNPDELADGDAIEAEFDAVVRGFDTIETQIDTNKAGYPSQTFHVAPATEPTHAIQQDQLEAALSFKLDAVNYNAADVLNKLKTVDGYDSGLDADCLDGQHGSYYRNADNINAGTLAKERLPGTIDSSTTGNAATATKVAATAPIGGDVDLVTGAMGGTDHFRIRVGGPDDAGWAEIATADNGNEPIFVRQYAGVFSSVRRTLTLLDGSGNTIIPGELFADGGVQVSDNYSGMYNGNADGAGFYGNNLKLSSWFGVGFAPTITGLPVPYGEYSHWFNTRNGDAGMRGTLTQNSDLRLKENILSIPDALTKVCSLRGITYDRKDGGGRSTGVIAQEVQAVLPEAVAMADDEQGTLSVAYGNLVGLLIESIKELKTEVDQLKTAVATP